MPLLRGRIRPPRALPRGGVQWARSPSSSQPLLLRLTTDCTGGASFQRPCGDFEPFVFDLPNRGLHLRSCDRPALLLQIEAGRRPPFVFDLLVGALPNRVTIERGRGERACGEAASTSGGRGRRSRATEQAEAEGGAGAAIVRHQSAKWRCRRCSSICWRQSNKYAPFSTKATMANASPCNSSTCVLNVVHEIQLLLRPI
jgi:hypothetical protein